jgi:hypothetical protein
MSDRISRQGRVRTVATTFRASWPQGATAGILLVAAACLAVSLTLYHLAGPRDVFADEVAGR